MIITTMERHARNFGVKRPDMNCKNIPNGLFFVLLVFGLVVGTCFPNDAWAASRRKGPYLIMTGDPTSMTVLWQLDGTAPCTLEWGTEPGYGMGRVQTTEYGNDHQHAHVISGLDAGTLYHFRVWMDGHPYTGAFRTPPGLGADHLKFMAYGDTRSYPSVHDKVAAAMLHEMELDPEYGTFLVVVGDLVSHGREESDWDQQFFDAAYPHIQELLASVPYHSCLGNHDLKGSGEDLFSKYLPYRWTAPHYGSFDYGPAHFTYVDEYLNYSPGSSQYQWIVSDLAATKKPWRFVVLHEPGWSTGNHSNDTDVQRYLQPLFERYGVAVVFAGHNHYYARAVVNGVQHITTGGGGAPLYEPDEDAPFVVAASKSYHFCRIEIDKGRLSFEAVTPDGTVIDSFSILRGLVRGRARRVRPAGSAARSPQPHGPR